MNKEEARSFLIDISYKLGNMAIEYLTEKDGEKMREAIKALEQEPCEDAIRRQEVIDAIDKWIKAEHILETLPTDKVTPLFKSVHKLPPVNPQPKMGKWIRHDTGHNIYYDCSLCSCCAPCTETADKTLWKLSNFCPDCGAKMENDGERWR